MLLDLRALRDRKRILLQRHDFIRQISIVTFVVVNNGTLQNTQRQVICQRLVKRRFTNTGFSNFRQQTLTQALHFFCRVQTGLSVFSQSIRSLHFISKCFDLRKYRFGGHLFQQTL